MVSCIKKNKFKTMLEWIEVSDPCNRYVPQYRMSLQLTFSSYSALKNFLSLVSEENRSESLSQTKFIIKNEICVKLEHVFVSAYKLV